MQVKLYCLVLNGGEYEDMEVTLNFEKALEWLSKRQKTGQILEYSVSDEGISDTWKCVWYYFEGKVTRSLD